MRRGVFISHSANEHRSDDPDDPADLDPALAARREFARQVRQKLADGIRDHLGEDCAWYDSRSVRAGDDWEHEVISALHTCAAAVILITPEALTSPWVLRETIVLVDRKLRHPDLVIIPIYLAGAGPQTLSGDRLWDTTRLTRIQGIVPIDASAGDVPSPQADQAAADAVDKAVPLLVDAVRQAAATEELPRWARNLTGPLKQLADGGYTYRLDEAAAAVGLRAPPDGWGSAAITNLARALITPAPGEDSPLLRAVVKLVDDPKRADVNGPEDKLCYDLRMCAAPATASLQLRAATAASAAGPIIVRMPPSSPDVPPEERFELSLTELVLTRAHTPDLVIEPHSGVTGEHADNLDPTVRDAIRRMAQENSGYANIRLPFVVLQVDDVPGTALDAVSQRLAALVAHDAPGAVTVVVTNTTAVATSDGSESIPITDEDFEYGHVLYKSLTTIIPRGR